MQDLTTLSDPARPVVFVIIPDGGTIYLQNIINGTPTDVSGPLTEAESYEVFLRANVEWTWRSEGGTNPQVKWYS